MKKEIITTKAVTIECPSIPNYIKVDGQMVHISSLSEGTLKLIAKTWSDNLIDIASCEKICQPEEKKDGQG